MTDKTWTEQRRAIWDGWQLSSARISHLIHTMPAPAPTLYRERDADQAVAHAEASIRLLGFAAEAMRLLALHLAPHLNACIGYDISDAMVIDLDLPPIKTAREWAEAKHEYTDEDAAEEAAEHRGDLERDGE